MSKINVLASLSNRVIKTKTQLKDLMSKSPDLVTFVPIPIPGNPAHEAVRGIATFIPAGTQVTVHSPTVGRQWTATVSRNENHEFTIK